MKKKIYNKRNISKVIIFMLIVIFTSGGLYNSYKINARATTIDVHKIIRILEIEPGDIFKFTETGGKSIDPDIYDDNKIIIPKIEKITKPIYGNYVQITHLTMPEFVSMVDEINGQYDIIVIGRENIKTKGINPWDPVKGLSSVYNYNTKYVDYTQPFYTTLDKVTFPSSYNEIEYYSENDITDKRKQEIENMIKSNQLVFIDNKIGADNYDEKISYNTENKVIKNSKLYSLYKSNNENNLKKFDLESISLEDIISEYKDSSNNYSKRPIINENSSTKTSIDSKDNINIEFNIYDSDLSNINFKLYLDKNGDGLYTEDESQGYISPKISENPDKSKKINILYKLNTNSWGYIGWKIEIIKGKYNSIPIKTNIIGSNILNKPNNIPKKDIKILQLFPSYWNDYSENDKPKEFKDNTKFQNLCNTIGHDYNISINRIRIDKFDSQVLNGTESLKNYNVVIIGFGKNDTIGSYNDKLSSKTINEIKDYIKSGQSIIFSSDTMSYQIPELAEEKSTLTQAFRDEIGQSRFKDPFNQSELDVYGNKIRHMDINQENKYSAGMTARNWTGVGENSQDKKHYIRNINKSKITSYPFDLNGKNIEVSKYDRTQVYQLNLEDQNIVPLYNIVNDGNGAINNGDSRNFYHSYSKGNITYWASLPDFEKQDQADKFPEDELKLFINTIINTQKNFTDTPVIKSEYLENNSQVDMLNNQIITLKTIEQDFNFTTKAIENNETNIEVKVYLDNEETPYITSDGFKPQGTLLPVAIPTSKIKQVFGDESKKINIKVTAVDESGNSAEENYILDVSNIISVNHGVYRGMSSNKIAEIDTSNNLKFATGTLVTFASNIYNLNNKNVSLEIDNDCNLVDEINIWSNDKKIKTINIKNIDNIETIKKYDLTNFTQNHNNVVITYTVKLNGTNKDKYTNIIVVDGNNYYGSVKESNIAMPDLF